MIFDEQTYSPDWTEDLPFRPPDASLPGGSPHTLYTHPVMGGVKSARDRWRLEPGLGTGYEISECLLLNCGFRLTLSGGQVFDLICLESGVFAGRIPAGAQPELFSTTGETERKDRFAFLQDGEEQIGLCRVQESEQTYLILCIHNGNRESCEQKLREIEEHLEERLTSLWDGQLQLRRTWTSRIPSFSHPQLSGLAMERVHGSLRSAQGCFAGHWFQNGTPDLPEFSLKQNLALLPALALFAPEYLDSCLQTIAALPRTGQEAWAEWYTPEGPADSPGTALPAVAQTLAALPGERPGNPNGGSLLSGCASHLRSFLLQDPSSELPQWPDPESAFTPEITDPDALIQFDLAAMLVAEIEALQTLQADPSLLEKERKQLQDTVLSGFWSEKRKRFLDKTPGGDFASRCTAATVLPLLWKNLDRPKTRALRQCLLNPEELRHGEGIRQWQPKKDDPIPLPVPLFTQHLFFPLLQRLPPENSALISADWHRMVEEDDSFTHPEISSLAIRLSPTMDRINPNLERYPAWVRRLEKHRKVIVTLAAAILLLIPAGFGVIFTLRSQYNRSDELKHSGYAETLLSIGQTEEAEEVYTRLIDLSRIELRKVQYHFHRGKLRFKLGKYEEALHDFDKTIELDEIGSFYKARWNLAQTYARLGRKTEAIDTMNAFIEEYDDEGTRELRQLGKTAVHLWRK